MSERRFVNRFKQAGAKLAVDFNRSFDNQCSYFVLRHDVWLEELFARRRRDAEGAFGLDWSSFKKTSAPQRLCASL